MLNCVLLLTLANTQLAAVASFIPGSWAPLYILSKKGRPKSRHNPPIKPTSYSQRRREDVKNGNFYPVGDLVHTLSSPPRTIHLPISWVLGVGPMNLPCPLTIHCIPPP